ncbi:MAG: GGDEF domain-containing protein [Lachnospiraceae bacterium]|nr:GGDEF domain-containing protein [Lachnospiraceae bacterium]
MRTENDIPYALLAVDVDISEIKTMIRLRTMEFAVIIIIIGALFTILFLLWARKNISQPLKLLEESAVAYARKSHGKRDVNELTFDAPEIHTQNEVESLSLAVKQMTLDIQDYVQSILEAERRAAQMSDLANKDALTGVRNKTAYDKEVEEITWRLEREPGTPYGIAIIDLNFLKKTNDTYGHDKGNISIVKLSRMVCSAFAHSPVFRIGGDEFAVILMDHDLQHIEELKTALEEALRISAESEDMEPWERISAAIGYAVFDAERDHEVEDVFRRADESMYTRKKEMKEARE